MSVSANIAQRLREAARQHPDQPAVLEPYGRGITPIRYRITTFAELNRLSDALAEELVRRGARPGMRLVLFVPFSTEFIAQTYALLKAGLIAVLIDPGMGRANIFRCLAEVSPDGFIAVPRVHAIRMLLRSRFAGAGINITAGRLWRRCAADESLMSHRAAPFPLAEVGPGDPAAIIFTSGSTGAPKGVVYAHGMFAAQVDLIQSFYAIRPGDIDLPGFPLFGLFNAAMGVTTVIPQMDPTHPAKVDPQRIVAAIEQQHITQAFGSPAFWNRVGRYCQARGITLPGLQRCLSAGGPVPLHVLERMARVLTGPDAAFHTPYGATESLPVASISAREVLERTAARTRAGGGTCVGRPFPSTEIAIIAVTHEPLGSFDEACRLPTGEIGEIIVRGPSVTREYFRREAATKLAKIPDPTAPPGRPSFWHRTGDVGYLDADGLLWYCGRKAHIVETERGRMYSVCCEGIFDAHPGVYRSALVGTGDRPQQQPVLIVEPEPDAARDRRARAALVDDLQRLAAASPLTDAIRTVLLHRSLPVDTRHNVKIDREALAAWAAAQLRSREQTLPSRA